MMKIHPCRQRGEELPCCWTALWCYSLDSSVKRQSEEWRPFPKKESRVVLFYHFHPFSPEISSHLFPFFFSSLPPWKKATHIQHLSSARTFAQRNTISCLSEKINFTKSHLVDDRSAFLLLMMAFISTSNMENANHHASEGWGGRKNEFSYSFQPTPAYCGIFRHLSLPSSRESAGERERDVNEIYGNFIVTVGRRRETKWIRMKNHLKIPRRISFPSPARHMHGT